MVYIVLGTILLLLLLWVSVYTFIRRKTEDPCRIVLLGPSNAGKTVFLASMYYRFEVEDPKVGFYLDIDPEKRERLIQYRKQITDNTKVFPDPTLFPELSQWKFTCRSRGIHTNRVVARFHYLDYAGERINSAYRTPTQQSREFQKFIDDAHVLVGVLDGKEFLSFMKGEKDVHFLDNMLLPILSALQRSTRPCHLIITKWDLFLGQYEPKDILKRLEQYDHFRNFVENHRKLATVRFIPVSALGPGYVRVQPDGSIQKVPNTAWKPLYVEMALACVLLDSFRDNLQRLNLHRQSALRSALASVPRPVATLLLLFYLIGKSVTISWAGPFGISSQLFLGGISILDFLQSSGVSSGPGGTARNRREAIEQTIANFKKLLEELETRFPESDLTNYNVGNFP